MQTQDSASGEPQTSSDGDEADKRAGPSKAPPTSADVQAWLISQLVERLGLEPDEIDVREPFDSYGLSSQEAVLLSGDLEDWLGRRLSPTLVYEYPTIEALSRYLAGESLAARSGRPPASTGQRTEVGQAFQPAITEPIAIIGIGCRFPGAPNPEAFWRLLRDGVDAVTEVPPDRWDARAFYDPNPEVPGKTNTRWGGFLEQVDQFDARFFGISLREATRMDPQQRLLLEVAWEALEDAGLAVEGLAGTRTGVFVGISTNDYGHIQWSDPRLIDAYAATSNSFSIAANRLSYVFDFQGPSVAVDTACSSSLVAVHLACQSLWNGESTLALAGGVNLILSPGVAIGFTKAGVTSPDGHCKAFDAQANGYVRGEGAGIVVLKPLSQALADGDPIYALIRGSAVGHDGRTNGLLAPNPQAQEAVIRAAYRRAGVSPGDVQYIEAHGTGTILGDPIEVQALGAVLVGGSAGDQPQQESRGRPPRSYCAIGSLKSNIGHLEAAAGIAGLIKVALALKFQAIPPSLHFQEPNPHIPFAELPLRVQQTLGPWPGEARPRLAGVSSFGFGGTDAHVVLEEAPEPSAAPSPFPPSPPFLLPLSARSPEALQALARAYREFLTGETAASSPLQDVCYTASVRRSHHDYRLALVGHSREGLSALLEAFLNQETRPGISSGRCVPGPRRRLVFVFPGQGSQWIGMGRELLAHETPPGRGLRAGVAQETPPGRGLRAEGRGLRAGETPLGQGLGAGAFRATLEQCDRAMRQYVDWSLLEELTADEAHSRLEEIDVLQPVLFAIEVALAALWRSWGVEPDAVVGHSMGELAAAYVAGAISLEDAARVICYRSQLLRRTSGQGAMAVVGLSFEQAQDTLAGYEDRVSVAVSNSPTSSVLSGDPAALAEIVERLQREGAFCRWVKGANVAGHSPQMDPLSAELVASLEGLQPQAPLVPFYSTVTGDAPGTGAASGGTGAASGGTGAASEGAGAASGGAGAASGGTNGGEGPLLDACYWGQNLRKPVLFWTAVQRLLEDGYDLFLEMSPHPTLLSAIRQGFQNLDQEGAALPSLQRGEGELAALLGSLGTLHTLGYPVQWGRLVPAGGQVVRLPSYPWQRERYWLEPEETAASPGWGWSGRGQRVRSAHPLLGRHIQAAYPHPAYPAAAHHIWEVELDRHSLPYLDDHRVQGAVLMPGAAYLEMGQAVAAETFGEGPHTLAEVEFHEPLFLPEADAADGGLWSAGSRLRLQVVLAPEAAATLSPLPSLPPLRYYVYSRPAGGDPADETWTLHATGRIRAGREEPALPTPETIDLAALRVRCPHEIAPAEFYGRLRENGLEYGPCFRGVEQVWRGDEEALGRLRIPPSLESQVDAYRLHPALLDAALQVLAAALLDDPADSRTGGLYLPVRVAEVRVYSRPPLQVWSHARLRASEERGAIIEGDLRLCDEAGHVIAEVVGLRLQRVDEDLPSAVPDEWEDWLYTLRWEPWAMPPAGSAPSPPPAGQRSSWLILADRGGVGQALQARLEACGQVCSVVQPGPAYEALPDPHHYRVNPASLEDFRHLFERVCGLERPPCAGILYLWSLDAPPPEGMTLAALESAQQAGCLGVLHLLQALSEVQQAGSPRLWLVTRGVQCGPSLSAPPALAQSPMWGLARVIAHEHPELRCTAVDLSATTPPEEIESLFQLLWPEEGEDQIALRGTERYVARLARFAPEPQRVWPVSGQAASPQAPSAGEGVRAVPGQTPFRLETSEPGLLDNLALRATTRQRPGPGEVEIQVRTAGLNFLDVLTALGLRPDLPEGPVQFGVECAGTIAALGEGVEEFQVGDEVIAIAPACFGSFAVTSAAIVVPKPAHLSFEEAATIPVAFLTSFYALHHLGRLAQGERVLIHAASGGVGLAAVQLAQRAGAEVFATAGSPEKREFLRSLGVEHVFDSRSLAFADEIMERTNRQGVDVVLNSLAGEAVPRSISTLRAYGRFLEIGKRDIYQDRQLGLRPFQNNLSFFAIDINRLLRERPAFARSLWDEVMQQFEDGSLRPLPLRVFPISQAVSAFRHMQQAKHIGKVVVSLEDREVIVEPPSGKPPLFRAEDTYLITGGLGGLGLAVAQWMVSQGARHLVLAGRSGATVAAQEAIGGMEQGGAQVKVIRADVTQEEQVAEMLAEIAHSTPPLRGIVHAAGILDDGILLQLDAERFRAVLAPKVSGAWNLHAHTLDLPLDLFVLFSSAASLLGPPGQGNYAAANAFLDALAHYRCAQGRPAISINWGPWASVGLAVRPERGGRLARRGFGSIAPAQGLQVLEQLLSQSAPQVAVMPVNWQRLRQLDPSAAQSALLAHLVYEQAGISPEVEAPQKGSAIRDALLAAEPGERQRLMESYLSAQVSRVIGVPVDRLDVLQSFTNLGIDSMMAVELKNRLRTDLGIEFPIVELFRHTTIRSLAKYLSGLQEGEEAPAREQSQTRAEAIRESRERQRALRQQQRAARE